MSPQHHRPIIILLQLYIIPRNSSNFMQHNNYNDCTVHVVNCIGLTKLGARSGWVYHKPGKYVIRKEFVYCTMLLTVENHLAMKS